MASRNILITPAQAGEILHVSIHTLKKWRLDRRNMQLVYYKIGNRILYDSASCLSFLESKKCNSKAGK